MGAAKSSDVQPLDPHLSEHFAVIADSLAKLRFGVIQLTVHDGKLMQIDVTERRRFPA